MIERRKGRGMEGRERGEERRGGIEERERERGTNALSVVTICV